MIPDQEEVNPVIDFSFYYFIGRAKLGLTFKETGRLTLTTFNRLYQHYKNNFDLELRLKNANITYEEAYNKVNDQEEWF